MLVDFQTLCTHQFQTNAETKELKFHEKLAPIAFDTAVTMLAVPSPKTSPLATTTIKLAWLFGFHVSQLCSTNDPMTRGIVHFGATYMPTAKPMPLGRARSSFWLKAELAELASEG